MSRRLASFKSAFAPAGFGATSPPYWLPDLRERLAEPEPRRGEGWCG